MELDQLTVKELVERLKNKEVSAVELTEGYLDRIHKLDDVLGAFITVSEEEALQAAKASDEKRASQKEVGALEGVPVAIKDCICTNGIRTTCASRMLSDFIPPYDATVVSKLKEAGAILLGKTNMDEFAMGVSTENSSFKKTKNPWNIQKVPGGSSGGSVVAVASGMSPFSLGSDTGGSIRQPASYCGLVGLKPTYGAVSRYGLVAYASSFDQIGPCTKTVYDSALVMNTIAGRDEKDATSKERNCLDYTKNLGEEIRGMKVAIPTDFFGQGVDAEVKEKVLASAKKLEKLGAIVSEISMPIASDLIPVYYTITCAEASSNLARYDGIRYGYKAEKYKDLEELYSITRAEGFGREVKRRIILGTYVLSSGYYDAYYKKAQKVRALIKEEYKKVFGMHDIILTPVAPTVAFDFGKTDTNPLEAYLNDICTVPVNVSGIPAMSLNCGFNEEGLPIGVQLCGNHFMEQDLLRVGYALEAELHLNNVPKLEV